MQSDKRFVGVRNNTYFSNYDLLNVMLNMFIGIWSSAKRLIYGLVYSLLFISRVDKARERTFHLLHVNNCNTHTSWID